MGLKKFKADIASAKAEVFEHVASITQGDSDGEVVFTFDINGLDLPLEIRALSTNVDEYPRGSSFLTFTSSDHADPGLVFFLESLASLTNGMVVPQVIRTISNKLASRQNPSNSGTISSEDANSDCHSLDEADLDSDDDEEESEDFEEMDIAFDPMPPAKRRFGKLHTSHSKKRLKKDLKAAKKAGFAPGYTCLDFDQAQGIYSLSIRVSKLGIPEEACEAWDLKPSDYIVLLCCLTTGYPNLPEILKLQSGQTSIQFRVGKSTVSKPSDLGAQRAFHGPARRRTSASSSCREDDSPQFLPLCMSAALETLLNNSFPSLLSIRRRLNMTWDQANSYLLKLTQASLVQSQDQPGTIQEKKEASNTSNSCFEIYNHDYAMDEENCFNLPLTSLQFALEKLVRCTEYCMVCHQRSDSGFEAVKPYVCNSDLCLYQYLALGFGQSIEHEIHNNPYVVDLLISFFVVAVSDRGLREFPNSLIQSVNPGYWGSLSEHCQVNVHVLNQELEFDFADSPIYQTLRERALVMLVFPEAETQGSKHAVLAGNVGKQICIIQSIQNNIFSFKVLHNPTMPDPQADKQTQSPETVWQKARLFRYNVDIDQLKGIERDHSLIALTHAIPSVLVMRKYLMENPGRRLADWSLMNPGALRLLNWIVASNRSFIVQDGAVPDTTRPKATAEEYDRGHQVKGLEACWMQFRFAQGSPEKEQKFNNQIHQLKLENRIYPSMFAWHGSPLQNWHSIIRTGLDFSTTAHGRAFGNGVYFSSDMRCSMGYVRERTPANSWANSQLKITGAISICEIINMPEQFVSRHPHYVVNRVEWIQCRYLFVRVNPSSEALREPFPKPLAQDSPGYIKQDPESKIRGLLETIRIPLTAIPVRRRRALTQEQTDLAGGLGRSVEHPTNIESDDDDTSLVESHGLSDSEDEETGCKDLQIITSSDNLTPFKPGALDRSSLPTLPDPSWASSSPSALRSLNYAVKELQLLQSKTEQSVLGWYIDFDDLNNMFHWIVELHSFDISLPLAQDMKRAGCQSIVLELRFGQNFPISPPFVRVVRPRFLPFMQGGGGHVTAGGAICSELLTQSGWSPALSLDKVFLQVRIGLCDTERPARLVRSGQSIGDYGIDEALDAYQRAANAHGWQIPSDTATVGSY